MSPDVISALVNFGSAGVVVIVVVIFLKYLQKLEETRAEREKDWQSFFTNLTASAKADMAQLRDCLEEVTKGISGISTDLKAHDVKVDDRVHTIYNGGRRANSQSKSQPR